MKKILTLSIITFISIFLFGITLATADGVPFEALQRQIDDLQQQITELQQGSICPAYSAHASSKVITEDPAIVMNKFLPAGEYVSNISLGVQYQAEDHGFWPECWAYLECNLVDGETYDPIPANGIGGNVVGILTHSTTDVLELSENTNVALSCKIGSWWCPDYPDTPLNLGGSWTLIRVDHK